RDDLAGRALDGFGLVMKEPCRPNEGFELRRSCLGHRGRGGEAFEQLRCHHVDANVGALRGEDGRDQQFPRRAMNESALGFRISFVETFEDGRAALCFASWLSPWS